MQNIILTQSPSKGGTIRRLFRKFRPEWHTRVIASYDDYSHGPIPQSRTSADFHLERQAFWKSLDLYDPQMIQESDLSDKHIALVNEIQSAKDVELWIGDSVQDLFYAVVTLHLLSLDKVDASGISVRHFGGDKAKWGLGALTVEEFESLYEFSATAPLDLRLYGDLWSVFSNGSGGAIKTIIEGRDKSTPLVKALSAYLLRFPDFNDGLGSIERALLGAGTDEMKKSAYTVGLAMACGGPTNDHVGDLILFKRLVELSGMASEPWFRLEGDMRNMRSSWAQITHSGKDACARYSVQPLQTR